jgi:23S rRNA pseudouridine1911/1915/1917 synthase
MEIIYEDKHIYVINKQAGILFQPEDAETLKTLQPSKNNSLHQVNRIDQVASGLVIIAKNKSSAAKFSMLFQEKMIEKTYLAFVKKGIANDEETIKCKLLRNSKLRKAFVNEKGKLAQLHYKKIGTTDSYDCLKIKIKEGRFHMIRCILSHLGMPIKGDVKYGARRKNSDRSIDLHSYNLQFTHPETKEIHNIIAPLRDNNLWRAVNEFL